MGKIEDDTKSATDTFNSQFHFGKVARFDSKHLGHDLSPMTLTTHKNDPNWNLPHPCPRGYKVASGGGGCVKVDTCFYDGSLCGPKETSYCQAGGASCVCNEGYLRYVPFDCRENVLIAVNFA